MYPMPLTGEPDHVDRIVEHHTGCETDQHAQKKRLRLLLHTDAAHAQHDGLNHPDQKNREEGPIYCHATGDRKTNRMDRPTGEPVFQRDQDRHDDPAEAEPDRFQCG